MASYQLVMDSPVGPLGLCVKDQHLIGIDFLPSLPQTTKIDDNPLAKEVSKQLKAYFKNPFFKLDIPIQPSGTAFQLSALQQLLAIPPGETRSYGEIANLLNTSPRAIGNACRRNPIPIIIPCHRVTAKNQIGGFSGERTGEKIAIKQWLLNHEKSNTG